MELHLHCMLDLAELRLRCCGRGRTFHISIGTASFVVALGMILFALIYDKSQIHIGTVLYQIVYSTCVDLFANCHIYSTYKWINFLIMLLGVVLFAVGTGLYASASLGSLYWACGGFLCNS